MGLRVLLGRLVICRRDSLAFILHFEDSPAHLEKPDAGREES